MLDELYTDYEDLLNMRLDNVDILISDMIDATNQNGNEIVDAITNSADSAGYALTDGLKDFLLSALDTDANIVSLYGDSNFNLTDISQVLTNIKDSVQEMVDKLNNDKLFFKTELYDKDKSKLDLDNIYDRLRYNDIEIGKNNMQEYYRYMGFTDEYKGTVNQHNDMIKWMKANGFKSGIKNIGRNQLAWTQENGNAEVIIRKADGAILTPLLKNDSVLNSKATGNLYDFMNSPMAFIGSHLDLSGLSVNPQGSNVFNSNNNISMSITLPNVYNYNDFVRELQHDESFEKMVQSMTIGRAIGKSSLRKYNI